VVLGLEIVGDESFALFADRAGGHGCAVFGD
jgi:hypothetical protein